MAENQIPHPLEDYARSGNPEAFAEIVRQHASLVYATARRLARNDALAHDITQATFIVLSKKARQVNPRFLAGWLVNTTRLAAREAIRAEQLRQRHEGQAVLMNVRPEQTVDGADVQQILPHLDEVLGALRMGDRTAVVLRFFQGASFVEVGSAMGITEEAARKRVTRALEQLRKLLKRRGVVASVAGLMVIMAGEQATAAPAQVVGAAMAVKQGTALGTVGIIAGRVMLAMKLAKGALAVAACLGLAAVGTSAVLF
jgi:RNA polymerase sigma factor (sigma-70 family)